jgi:hypothetical protein
MNYTEPQGYDGVGSDIGWCGRNQGGKRCQLCRHYAEYSTWAVSWHWYYLHSWTQKWYGKWKEYVHLGLSRRYRIELVRPVKYHTTGLDPKTLSSLLRNGCKLARKCKCVNLIQRGHWYCPGCWVILNEVAKSRGQNPHDLMIQDRKELKADVLILRLSGVI